MLDFGFDKIALIGAVALIVIGPEKLPRVARTVGALIGKAQRYVADVKNEVNRSIELEDRIDTGVRAAARRAWCGSCGRKRCGGSWRWVGTGRSASASCSTRRTA